MRNTTHFIYEVQGVHAEIGPNSYNKQQRKEYARALLLLKPTVYK